MIFFYNVIKFLLINNFIYKIYLKLSKKIEFEEIPNFNPILPIKKSLGKLMSINDSYFSANNENAIPIQMHSFEWLIDFKTVSLIKVTTKTVNDANIEESEEYLNIKETTNQVKINKKLN